MRLLIQNGRIIDPKENRDGVFDILIQDEKVMKIEKNIDIAADIVIDATDRWVVPGLIDLHVHLREPGFEHKETIETGSKAAVRGGFTTICCMPNTNPTIDNENIVQYINEKAKKTDLVHILPIGAITKGLQGEEISNIEKMVEAGICAVSDDGKTVMNAALLKRAMIETKQCRIPMFSHCEDMTLAGGAMNAGKEADRLGIKGIGNEAEDIITARDIILAKYTGVKLHLCHVSTKLSLEIIRFAKAMGMDVTAETAPHYFSLTDERVNGYDTNAKMNPPLRTNEDVEAVKKALQDGTLDVIATDHAPHHEDEKNVPFEKAPFGIVGLETSFAVSYTYLVKTGILTPSELIEKMSTNPAKILGINKGTIAEGKMADITIINPDVTYKINSDEFVSKSKNTPFGGAKVKGQVEYTIVQGNIVYKAPSKE